MAPILSYQPTLGPLVDRSQKSTPPAVHIIEDDDYSSGDGLWDEELGAPPYFLSSNFPTTAELQQQQQEQQQTYVVARPAPLPPKGDSIRVVTRRRYPSNQAGSLLRKAVLRAALNRYEAQKLHPKDTQQFPMPSQDIITISAPSVVPSSLPMKSDSAHPPQQQGLKYSVTAPPRKTTRKRKWIGKETELAMCEYYRNNEGITHKEVAEKFNFSRSAVTKVLRKGEKTDFPSYYLPTR